MNLSVYHCELIIPTRNKIITEFLDDMDVFLSQIHSLQGLMINLRVQSAHDLNVQSPP